MTTKQYQYYHLFCFSYLTDTLFYIWIYITAFKVVHVRMDIILLHRVIFQHSHLHVQFMHSCVSSHDPMTSCKTVVMWWTWNSNDQVTVPVLCALKSRRFRIDRSVAWELIPLFGPWSRRGLNPTKPVYDPDRPDGRLNLTASAFNQLGQ